MGRESEVEHALSEWGPDLIPEGSPSNKEVTHEQPGGKAPEHHRVWLKKKKQK